MSNSIMMGDISLILLTTFLLISPQTCQGSLEDDIREVVQGPHGEEINTMSLRDFVVTLLLLYFLRPWLAFATRNRGGQGVRDRGGTTLARLMGQLAHTGNLGGDIALATRISGT